MKSIKIEDVLLTQNLLNGAVLIKIMNLPQGKEIDLDQAWRDNHKNLLETLSYLHSKGDGNLDLTLNEF